MPAKMIVRDQAAWAVATALEDLADRARDRRKWAYENGKMPLKVYEDTIASELELRSLAAQIVARSLGDVISQAQTSQTNIEQAIVDANEKIKDIKNLKHALGIFAAVITLAGAICAGNVRTIGKALVALISEVRVETTAGQAAAKKLSKKPAPATRVARR